VEGDLVSAEILLRERPATMQLAFPAGTEVSIDGRYIGQAPLREVEVPAGTHVIGLSRVGHVAELRTVVLERGQTRKMTATLAPTAQRRIAVGTLIGGAAGVVAGTVFLGVAVAVVADSSAKKRHDDAMDHDFATSADLAAYDDALSRRDTWARASTIAFGAGAGLLVVGGLLYFLDHPRPDDAPTRLAVDTGPGGFRLRF
jgi:hypothetical protein